MEMWGDIYQKLHVKGPDDVHLFSAMFKKKFKLSVELGDIHDGRWFPDVQTAYFLNGPEEGNYATVQNIFYPLWVHMYPSEEQLWAASLTTYVEFKKFEYNLVGWAPKERVWLMQGKKEL